MYGKYTTCIAKQTTENKNGNRETQQNPSKRSLRTSKYIKEQPKSIHRRRAVFKRLIVGVPLYIFARF